MSISLSAPAIVPLLWPTTAPTPNWPTVAFNSILDKFWVLNTLILAICPSLTPASAPRVEPFVMLTPSIVMLEIVKN